MVPPDPAWVCIFAPFFLVCGMEVYLKGRRTDVRASPALPADREVVLAAVARDGWALKWACPTLQADPDVVLVARARALGRDEPLQDVADVLCSPKRKHGPFAGAVRATKMQRCRLDQHTDAPERCTGTDIPNLIE